MTTTTLQLASTLASGHPADAARVLEGFAAPAIAELLAELPIELVRRLIEEMNADVATEVVTQLPAERVDDLFAILAPRRATGILRRLPDADREAIYATWSEEQATRFRKWAGYPAETAAAMMDPQVMTLTKGMTVEDALRKLRTTPRETITYLYVTDHERKLVAVLTLRSLLLALPEQSIDDLPCPPLLTIPADMDREDVAHLMQDRKLLAMPVVDEAGELLGVVRHGEAVRALQSEAFSELQKMVGAGEDERALSPVGTVVRKRLPWLVINLGTAFLAAFVVGMFESTIAAVTALAVLLPVVAGQGGNTGAQSMAVVMRGISLRELTGGNTRRLLVKEMIGALINGVAIAVICGVAVYFWDGRVALSAVIGIAMVANMGAAGLAGAAVPLILKKLGFDPAQASSIVLTTVTDVVGFAAFLGCAVLFMPMLT